MKQTLDVSRYLVTDRRFLGDIPLELAVEQAILGGCTMVQLREKELSAREFFELARRVLLVTRRHGVPLLINDRADVALAVGADGVHVGQSDLPCAAVRAMLGADRLVGVSAATVEEAVRAQRDGASYLGVGAMHPTSTKQNTRPVTPQALAEIKRAVSIPVVAIGGLCAENLGELSGTGVDGVAVVSAILAQPDIRQAAEKLSARFREVFHG